ncbi:MAG: 2-isopropylmalate synthase [Victivallales bacterium]|nr:2-isopropylmalate synthase [Victivallales bacterium]
MYDNKPQFPAMEGYAYPRHYSPKNRQWPTRRLTKSPAWCAVDLRDGNQALPKPMDPYQKESYFKLLTDVGFKEIEIGFPAASMDEWTFCRDLIERSLIPSDVTVSVLTQAREHIIRRTMNALKGIHKAVCHIYIPISELHYRYVLGETRKELVKRTLDSVRLVRKMADDELNGSKIGLEFSPEEFTDADLDFAVELCDAVVETWNPMPGEKIIINLPCTVERALPTFYPDRIEAFIEKSTQHAKSIISLHAHNDMGGAVASTELALLAGGERVEGTLFGNGERSGNLDLVTFAMNLQYLGLDTGLDFSDLEELAAKVSELTSMPIPPRQPYAGELVFTAFSGSHQDAIHKGLDKVDEIRNHFHGWKIPYLHINPATIGRSFAGAIRINSQSGRGGIAHVLAESYGIQLPKELLTELANYVQKRTEEAARELRPDEIWDLFLHEFAKQDAPLRLINYWPRPDVANPSKIHSEVHLEMHGKSFVLHDVGDGPVAAFANAMRQLNLPDFKLINYEERSIGSTVDAESITIVSMEKLADGKTFFGVGFGANIVHGAVSAIVSSLNRMMRM